jgi:hypothetical protein
MGECLEDIPARSQEQWWHFVDNSVVRQNQVTNKFTEFHVCGYDLVGSFKISGLSPTSTSKSQGCRHPTATSCGHMWKTHKTTP